MGVDPVRRGLQDLSRWLSDENSGSVPSWEIPRGRMWLGVLWASIFVLGLQQACMPLCSWRTGRVGAAKQRRSRACQHVKYGNGGPIPMGGCEDEDENEGEDEEEGEDEGKGGRMTEGVQHYPIWGRLDGSMKGAERITHALRCITFEYLTDPY